jgi:hypothetical protein
MNMTTLPDHLKSTFLLLQASFPSGVDETKCPYLMRVFYDHLSDENMAIVFSAFLNKDIGIIRNEIYSCASICVSDEKVIHYQRALEQHGFNEWLDEE